MGRRIIENDAKNHSVDLIIDMKSLKKLNVDFI